jgi:protein-S-isoprenylcysteine O-methyltransferase Ste14
LVIVAIGWGLVNWAELVNPFFSGAVRIQADRGQRVVSQGPYAIVRHPAYTGRFRRRAGSQFADLNYSSRDDRIAHSDLPNDD